jgi:hypothetical protein
MDTVQPMQATATPGARPGPDDASLLRLAVARPDLSWPVDADISVARNAHYTNTRAELAGALGSEFDWLEGDVRLDRTGRPVMQHDRDGSSDLDLATWLRVAGTSGRGAKLDIKERAALPATIDLVQRSGIDQRRLIVNVGIWPAAELSSIRQAFPDAIINLGPGSNAALTRADLIGAQVAARIVGGRVMFPIRQDFVTPCVVDTLKPFGRVAVWNSPKLTNPGPQDAPRLREMGVDGMIDLREPDSIGQHASSAVIESAAWVFGWDPVRRALDGLGLLKG